MCKQQLLLMAQYNIWATERLVQHLKTVTDEDLYRDVGLFFKSIFGTLNHLLLGEHYLWYRRFTEGVSPAIALSTPIESDCLQCLEQLNTKSRHWIDFIHTLTDERLAGSLSYKRVNGEALCLPFTATLLHVFNHGTHHRGQITAALTALGYECPELDLVYMLVEQSRDHIKK
ncbi:DinB family protein [Acinetobacter silvestris]|uniref:Damage-inducible protein DinB n=1 Tax=Acinetobacter silvestris TaxID=1977882 RepID=A0A1Y3CFI1_9GAMM|nr:DinB family protein [Acinetobacter silvestris]OTG65870.1 damage-inducible protein DinB [Acinetobacter silvestris]